MRPTYPRDNSHTSNQANANRNIRNSSRRFRKHLGSYKRVGTFVVALVICATVTSVFFYNRARAATTYTWNQVGTGSWAIAGNWTPARTTPAADDILVFNNGATTTVTNVPTQTIGQLLVSGNTTANLQTTAAVTVTIAGGGGTDLDIQSGSSLNCNAVNAITIAVGTGATGNILGSMTFSAGAATAHRLTSADAGGITFNTGSTFTAGTSFSGNAFGTTNLNSVVFASGSTYVLIAGSNPFGAAAPNSVVVFQSGSTYRHQATASPAASGRTYPNFELNVAGTASVSGSSAFIVDNLTITQGTLQYSMTGTPGHAIRGNISIASGATLSFNTGVATTVTLNGTSAQTISGAGTLSTISSFQTISFANAAGVTLQRNIASSGPITVSSGILNCGTNVISGSGTFNVVPGATLGIGSASGITTFPTAAGNIQNLNRIYNAGANYVYNGTAAQVTGNGLPTTLTGTLTISNSAGVTLSQDTTVNGASSIASGATLDTSTFRLAVGNTLTNSGTFNVNGSFQIDQGGFGTGTNFVYAPTATLIFNNSSGSFGVNNNAYWPTTNGPNNVTVQNTGGITMNVARTVGGSFQYAAGVSGASNLTLNGAVQVNTGGFVSGSPTYGAASSLRYNTGGTYGRNGEWLPGVSSGAGYPIDVQLSSNTTLDLPNSSTGSPFQMAGNLTIDSGSTMQMAGATPLTQPLNVLGSVNINGGTLTLSTIPGGDLNVGGNWSNSGTLNSNSRTVTFNGSGNTQTLTGSSTFAGLTINHSGAGSVTAAGSTLNVTGLLRLQQGTFTSATAYNNVQIDAAGTLTLSGPITVSGNWTNSGGTFTPGTNSVTFNGATGQTITGNTSFYDFIKSVAAAQQFNFTAGSTTTVTNSLTLTGASGNLLSLRSTTPGTQWNLNAPTTQSVSFVDVQDSNASGGQPINQTNSVDSGNNVNWSFVGTDYTVTTTGNAIAVTDVSGNGDTLTVSEPAAGQIKFAAPGRGFSVDGGAAINGDSGNISLTGINSITVDAAAGADTINLGAFATSLPSLNLNGGTGDDAVNFNGNITFASNANLDADLQNDDATPGTDAVNFATSANVLLSGTGAATIKVSRHIAFGSTSKLQVVNGNLILEANQQAIPTAGDFNGIDVFGGTIQSTGTGNINIKGTGGAGDFIENIGVLLSTGGMISATGAGTIDVQGTGGAGSGGATAGQGNLGVYVTLSSTIISSTSAVDVTGTGGTTNDSNVLGITVDELGTIETSGAGTLTLNGTGGTVTGGGSTTFVNSGGVFIVPGDVNGDGGLVKSTGTGVNAGAIIINGTATNGGNGAAQGVRVDTPGAVTTVDGPITITGTAAACGNACLGTSIRGNVTASGTGAIDLTGTGAASTAALPTHGVNVRSGGVVSTVNGNITITGTGGNGTDNAGFNLASSGTGTVQTTGTGTITVNADKIVIRPAPNPSATINSGSNTVNLRQKTNGVAIDLGSTVDATANTLELSDLELDRITAGTLNFGTTTSGAETVSAPISRATATILNLTSGAAINLNASSLNSGGGNVTLAPGASSNVAPTATGTDVSTGATATLSFASGADLAIVINGTTVDTQYRQLNVVGQIDLTGVDLVLSGTHTPLGGQTFMIVNNDGADAITGTFNGLAQGATIPNFLGSTLSATISYTGGDGNDVVLAVVTPCTPPSTVYVDDDWFGTTPGTDPDGAGPATNFGCDSFATIQEGINGVVPGGIVNVFAGTYDEDVSISQNGTRLLGAGAGTTNIRGPIGGDSSTVHVLASNVTVAGFTITRLGNNTTDWNNPGLNTAGIAIQGTSLTGTLVRDNIITGNRTGIDVNNSSSHVIRNNVIDFNRTGMIFRNQTDSMTVVENFVTNNWTVGILFLDASGGTNVPVQSALGSVFSNNNLSANWYGQIVDRQSGGSLPAPGTTNLKNFRGDWFGTTSPVVTTANSAEPGYAAQIPVAYGGTATPPGGQPDIAGPASANFKYIPFLQSGTDTNVETTPGRGTFGFQGVANATIVVRSNNLQGWTQQHSTCGAPGTGSQAFVVGPATPPLGEGSLQYLIGSNGDSFETARSADFNNTRLDALSRLSYGTYVVQDGSGGQAPYLLLNIDYTGDNLQDDQIFFEPVYQHGFTANVPDQGALVVGTWQTWNALVGGWWSLNNVAGATPGAGVKTLAQYLAAQPNARILSPASGTGGFRIATGCGAGAWDNFIGDADDLFIGVSGADTRYDFEPLPRLSIDDVTHNEGNSGTTAYDFTVTLSSTSDQTITVDYATADHTATAPSDYTAIPTTQLIFNPGETSKPVTVQVKGENVFEGNEQFFVNLSNVNSNATILDGQGVGTITNDDSPCVTPSTVYVDDSWVGTAPGTDPDGAGPATNFGCDSFATIQDGVTAVPAGGTVIVNDGTYTENVNITKAMTLRGAQFGVDARGRVAAESTVSPATASSPTFTVAFNGLIAIDGFSFTGGTSLGVIQTTVGPNNNMQIKNNRFSGYSQSAVFMNRGGSDITIDQNVMDGSNIAGSGQAIFGNGPQSFAGLFITNNNIINNTGRYGFFVDGNHNVGESATRAALISGNLFNNNLQGLNLGSRSFGTLGTPVLGTFAGTISNNTFSNHTANGIQAGIQHVLVTGNTFSSNAVDGLALTSFGNTAADRGAQNSTIVSNTFTGHGRAGIFFSGTQGVGLIETNHANFNRIVGNAVGIQYGSSVAAGNNATIDVENNWWGCNFGPGAGGAGCGATANGTLVFAGNTGVLDSNPWIVLGTSASPNPIPPGGNSTVTADMTHNSDNAVVSGPTFVPPVGVTFSATNGTMAPPSGTITSGQANSTFTSNSTSSGTACSMVDNQNVCTPIGITLPSFAIDDVTHNEGDSGTTSYVFTVTKTGSTTFASSVAFTTQDGTATLANNDYQMNSGTLNFAPTDTTMQITVLVNGDTAFEPNEAFNVQLSSPVDATITDADGAGTITNDDAPCPATLTVNNNGDASDLTPGDGVCATAGAVCTLRAAIEEANSRPSCGTIDINFSVSTPNTINLSLGELPVNHNVNINGPGANLLTVQRASGTIRIFSISSSMTVSISGLTITNGLATSFGGGVLNQGTLTIADCIVTGNGAFTGGGGVANLSATGADASLTITGSTIGTNSANGGGGVYNASSGGIATLTIINSTISGNTSGFDGGGVTSTGSGGGTASLTITNSTVSGNNAVNHAGGINVISSTATLTNVTVTNNRADSDNNGNGVGGGLSASSALLNLRNTIVAGNFRGTGTFRDDVNGAIESTSSFNLIGDGSGMFGISHGTNGNMVGSAVAPIDPLLGPLQNNGGPTSTHALLVLSPATDSGDDCVFTNTCTPSLGAPLTTDQRGAGFTRQANGNHIPAAVVDIGAYERQTPTASDATISGRIVDDNGSPVEGAAIRMAGTQNRLTVTDAQGNYHFDAVQTSGFYTVVPSRTNYTFSPAQLSFSQIGEHTDAVFTASSTGGVLNPLDTTEYFVRQQYLDFLGREPDEAGLNFWVNNIETCGADNNCRRVKLTDTSAAFFLSIEFQQTGYLVYRMYQSAYGDIPGAPVPLRLAEFRPDTDVIGRGVVVNQSGWEAKLEANKQAFITEFVQRSRFTSAYPATMTPTEFVDRMFQNAGVAAESTERAAAINEFGSMTDTSDAASRARALRRVAENATLRQQEFNQAFVLMQYFGYLRRDPNTGPDTDFSGYNFWLNKLDSFNGDFRNAEMVRAFLVAGEYRGRFPR